MIPFARYLLNSVIVTPMAIAGQPAVQRRRGYALTKHFPGRRWIVVLLLSCMLIPSRRPSSRPT
jgi:ABC-type glycerol-3-phosphate transport system permease component